jgi:hypothetical protein
LVQQIGKLTPRLMFYAQHGGGLPLLMCGRQIREVRMRDFP